MTISDCPHNGLGGTRVSNSQLSLEASSSTVERCRNSHTCDSHVHAALRWPSQKPQFQSTFTDAVPASLQVLTGVISFPDLALSKMGSAVSHCEAEEAQDDEQQDEGPQMSGVHVARRVSATFTMTSRALVDHTCRPVVMAKRLRPKATSGYTNCFSTAWQLQAHAADAIRASVAFAASRVAQGGSRFCSRCISAFLLDCPAFHVL